MSLAVSFNRLSVSKDLPKDSSNACNSLLQVAGFERGSRGMWHCAFKQSVLSALLHLSLLCIAPTHAAADCSMNEGAGVLVIVHV